MLFYILEEILQYENKSININHSSIEELEKFIAVCAKSEISRMVVNSNSLVANESKLLTICRAFAHSHSFNNDKNKTLSLLYSSHNYLELKHFETTIAQILSLESSKIKSIEYSFHDLENESVDKLLELIVDSNTQNIRNISLVDCNLANLSIENFRRVVSVCKAKKVNSIRLFKVQGLKSFFAKIDYQQQQEVSLSYLELISAAHVIDIPYIPIEDIPFDLTKNPEAFFELCNNFIAINHNKKLAKHLMDILINQNKITKSHACKLFLKLISLNEGIQTFDPNDLSIENTCLLIQESKDVDTVVQFLSRNYIFANTYEKGLFLGAVFGRVGHINYLYNLPLEFSEIIQITNELQIGGIASTYLSMSVEKLSFEQKIQLLELCQSYNCHVNLTSLKLTPKELVLYSKKNKRLYYLAEELLGSGLTKTEALNYIENILIEFDAANTQISLNALVLTKEDILEFIKRNTGWGHVLDEWLATQEKVISTEEREHLPLDTLKELLEVRLKNSAYFISEYSFSRYRVSDAELPNILVRASDAGCYIDDAIIMKLKWEDRYRIFQKEIERDPITAPFNMRKIAADGGHPELYEFLSCFPEDINEATDKYTTTEELFAYFATIRTNLIDTFCKVTSCSEEAQHNLSLVDKKLFNTHVDLDNVVPYIYNLLWLVGLCSRVLLEVEPNQIQHCFIQKFFITTLEEIASFASPDTRVKLIGMILPLIKDQEKFSGFCQLLESTKNRRSQIPALIIAANVQQPIKFASILKMIGSEYHDNKNLKILLNGFTSLFSDKNITDDQKFKIAYKVLSYDVHFKVVNSVAELQFLHTDYLKGDNLDFNQMYITQINNTNQFGLLAYNINGNLVNLTDISFDPRLKDLKDMLQAWVKNDKKIARIIKQSLVAVTNTKIFPCGLASEQQALLMLQGLAAINKLALIVDDPSFKTQAWMAVYGTVLQTCFELSADKLHDVQATLSTCRNPFSIIAYYAQLKTLVGSSAPYIDMLKSYVRLISSPRAQDFYHYRYDLEQQPQLKAVVGHNLKLLSVWRKGYTISYDDFYMAIKDKFKQLDAKKLDAKEFLIRQICHFKHLPETGFSFLHQFFAATDLAAKEIIYDKVKTKIKDYNDENYQLKQNKRSLELQLAIMDYFNQEGELDVREKLQKLNKIETISESCIAAQQFNNDMDNLTSALWRELNKAKQDNTTKREDTGGWKITDADNFWDMFLIGTDVFGSCQNVNGTPSLNRCLIGGYVLSGHIRQIAIKNLAGEIVSRAVFRLMRDKATKQPALFLEEVYPHYGNEVYTNVIEAFAMLRAWQLGCTLASKTSVSAQVAYDNPLEVVAVKQSEYVDAIGTEQTSGYEVTGSTLIYDVPKARLDLQRNLDSLGMLLGRASYGPRPLSSIQDLKFMYSNYLASHNSQASALEFVRSINLRLNAQ